MNSPEPNPIAFKFPVFVHKKQEGIYVDCRQLESQQAFYSFVDALVESGYFLTGLNYPNFNRVAFPVALSDLTETPEILIAAEIAIFSEERQRLYRGLKIADNGLTAEYVFEPLTIEITTEAPVYGHPNKDGSPTILRYKKNHTEVPATINFDEFVLAMWARGLRFGINEAVVRNKIDTSTAGRVQVAVQLNPVMGQGTEIIEASDALKRDDAPIIRSDGKTDLKRFKNRFPHVATGTPILKKVFGRPSTPGYTLSGSLLEADKTEDDDIDLSLLVGPGTRIVRDLEGESIVADQDGFLTLDLKNNRVSVTENIENHEGISLKTTGNVALSVGEYIEHGEVQEGREVEGRNMTFKANMYGHIHSIEGSVILESNLSGGSITSDQGNVTVMGRCSNASIVALAGKLTIKYAESSTIIGKHVEIERAVHCEIVAEHLEIETSEACGMVAKQAHIQSTMARKGKESVITLVTPDFLHLEQKIAELQESIATIEKKVTLFTQQMTEIQAEPEFAKFFGLGKKIRKGEIQLTEAQKESWQIMSAKHLSKLKRLQDMDAVRKNWGQQISELKQEIEGVEQMKIDSSKGISCKIESIHSDTVVQQASSVDAIQPWAGMSSGELKSVLHTLQPATDRLFSGHEGDFFWEFKI